MSQLNLNVFNIIIISGVIHGIIFSVSVASQKKHITSNTLYLALVVLFLSLSNLQYWVLDTGLINKYPIIEYVYIPWHWLILPMFYMYVKRYISMSKIANKGKAILISPFFIVLIIHIIQVLYKVVINKSYEIPSHFGRGVFVYIEFFSVAFNVFLIYLSYRTIVTYEADDSFEFAIVKSEIKWLKDLIYTGLLTCFFWLVAIIIVVAYDLNKSYVFYPLWIGTSILVYWLGYVGLNNSKLLKERIGIRKRKTVSVNEIQSIKKTDKLFSNLEELIVNGNLYLNPNFKLKHIASILNLSEGYVSQLINKNSDLNFNDFVNKMRIEESKKMLSDDNYGNYTITAIGLESGFNSKTSFYTAFKKFTNKTPTEYRKAVRNL